MSEVSPWSVIQSIAERRIEESMAKGDFDDLPGRGKPLELEDDSHVPPELRMAYKVLRNAGCVPPELAERKEISNLADMLEHCEDEQERVRQMQKLRFMILQARMTTACWSGFPGTTGKNSVFCSSGKRTRKKAARRMRGQPFSVSSRRTVSC